MADVPCGGCTLCCRGNQFIPLMDNDKTDFYVTQQISGVVGLAWKVNGDCFYVTDKGCSIHERAPQVCRFYDCRGHFLAQKHPDLAAAEDPIMARGRELLAQQQRLSAPVSGMTAQTHATARAERTNGD